jgi:hypothetical protein
MIGLLLAMKVFSLWRPAPHITISTSTTTTASLLGSLILKTDFTSCLILSTSILSGHGVGVVDAVSLWVRLARIVLALSSHGVAYPR